MNIGDIVQGGIFFYSGSTVLIAAQQDIKIPLYWGCYGVGVGGTLTAIGKGQANTNLILSGCTGNTMIAGYYCDTITISGLTDWYLPSKDELNEMYLQKEKIGGFDTTSNYWSSSQYTPETAWMQFFLNGTQSDLGGKDQLYKVRPIRTYIP
jgi:hypothetical protein